MKNFVISLVVISLFVESWSGMFAFGDIVAVTGDFEVVSPPPSVRRQDFESSTSIHIFLESEVQVASIPVNAINPGIYHAYSDFVDQDFYPTGPIRSYFIHFDPAGQSLVQLSGSVTFSDPILAVIGRSLTMEQTDGILGAPSTLYPTNRYDRELEYEDRGNYDYFELEADGHTLFTRMEASTEIDQIRIITAVPEPASWKLIFLALSCIALLKCLSTTP